MNSTYILPFNTDHDDNPVWTSSDCGRCGVTSKMTHKFDAALGSSSCQRIQDERAFVRCCADEGSSLAVLTGTSCKTCSELGWLGAGIGSAEVCAASRIISNGAGGTSCLTAATTFEVRQEHGDIRKLGLLDLWPSGCPGIVQ